MLLDLNFFVVGRSRRIVASGVGFRVLLDDLDASLVVRGVVGLGVVVGVRNLELEQVSRVMMEIVAADVDRVGRGADWLPVRGPAWALLDSCGSHLPVFPPRRSPGSSDPRHVLLKASLGGRAR